MESKIFANKYRVVDTLFQSELQNIYVVEDIDYISEDQFLLNEILDSSSIYALKEDFKEDLKLVLKNFIGFHYEDTSFCIVSSLAPGTSLNDYLSSNSLRISDKMIITDHLLHILSKMDSTNRLLKQQLLSMDSITVAPNRSIGFNLNFKLNKDDLYVTAQSLMNQLGKVICSIFANTPEATLEQDKDSLPPAIAVMVKKCMSEGYSNIDAVYKDFKSSLLFSTFVGGSSVDRQIMKNIQRAKYKRSMRPFRRFAAVCLVAAILLGGYYAWNNRNSLLPAIGGKDKSNVQQNQIPTAKFSLSKNKVYVGDEIGFVSESTDPDFGDKIASYEWSVSRNNDVYVLFSREENPSYLFEREGDYVVSLIVKDSTGISSNAYKVGLKVVAKEEIPEDAEGGVDSSILK